MLSFEQIQEAKRLGAGGRKKRGTGTKKFAWLRGEDGQLTKVPLSEVPAEMLGSFTGRAGSIRRSRKGATRRLANGRRNYVVAWKSPVVSYRS